MMIIYKNVSIIQNEDNNFVQTTSRKKNDYTSKEQQQRVEWNGETNPGCENGVW